MAIVRSARGAGRVKAMVRSLLDKFGPGTNMSRVSAIRIPEKISPLTAIPALVTMRASQPVVPLSAQSRVQAGMVRSRSLASCCR